MSFINGIPSDSEKLKGESLNRPGKKKKAAESQTAAPKDIKKYKLN